MQNWKDLYLELSNKIVNNEKELKEKVKHGEIEDFSEIRWIDLWHNQVSFLEEEHPFPTPAIFLGFRGKNFKDVAEKVQDVKLQVDVYLFYETFLDTFKGAYNQESALEFIDALDRVNAVFHGSEGQNYSSMSRIGLSPIDTGGSGNLYQLIYECTLIDFSAKKIYEKIDIKDFDIEAFIV